jgi:hypothetical protein
MEMVICGRWHFEKPHSFLFTSQMWHPRYVTHIISKSILNNLNDGNLGIFLSSKEFFFFFLNKLVLSHLNHSIKLIFILKLCNSYMLIILKIIVKITYFLD